MRISLILLTLACLVGCDSSHEGQVPGTDDSTAREKNDAKTQQSAKSEDIAGFAYLGTESFECNKVRNLLKKYKHLQTGLEFILLPGGNFKMGDDRGYASERPQHAVRVAPFLIARYETTNEVWSKAMGEKSYAAGKEKIPVGVSWEEAKTFCKKYDLNLPSEAQWEYACRAGSSSRYYWGEKMDSRYFWHSGNSERKTRFIGQKLPNAFGLYDMSGNVWEWCEDMWFDNYQNAPGDDRARLEKNSDDALVKKNLSSLKRAYRGGSAMNTVRSCSSSRRDGKSAGKRSSFVGFRVCKNLPKK